MRYEVRLLRDGVETIFGTYPSLTESNRIADQQAASGYYRVRVAVAISDVGRIALESLPY